MPINVTDIVYQGGGMIVTFDDNSVATAVQTVLNGQVVYAGLSIEQALRVENIGGQPDHTIHILGAMIRWSGV